MEKQSDEPADHLTDDAASDDGVPSSFARWALVCIFVFGLAILGWKARQPNPEEAIASSDNADRLPREKRPLPESPFLNTRDVAYVGSEKCQECHQDVHDSYRLTGMGQAFQSVVPAQEPDDGTIIHDKSHRRFEIQRESSKLIHRELLVKGNRSVLIAEHPVKYRVGSGHHARTYLCEIDGFLVESPATWYESVSNWNMSPGYDTPHHQGFERDVGQSCLRCHVGRSSTIGQSSHRMAIEEDWISCERCHGPGEMHIASQSGDLELESQTAEASGTDYTIVNPAHLDRNLSVDMCAQCHEHPLVSVPAPDRDINEFLPGLPLDAFRVTFRHATDDSGGMTVVGHVGQMKLSRCYQASDMSCLTCHDIHNPDAGTKSVDHDRQMCLQCHQSDACGLTLSERQMTSQEDNCLKCHMPNSDTDIVHVAFTHHRIGIHDTSKRSSPPSMEHELSEPLDLIPASDQSLFTEAERTGLLGAAYDEYALRGAGSKFAEAYQEKSYQLLKQAWDNNGVDADMAGKLAFLAMSRDESESLNIAAFTLRDDHPGPVSPGSRTNAILVQMFSHLNDDRLDEAANLCELLTTLRRNSVDWDLLAKIEFSRNRVKESIEALERAVEINPMRSDLRLRLMDYYQRTGNRKQLQHHEDRLLPPSSE